MKRLAGLGTLFILAFGALMLVEAPPVPPIAGTTLAIAKHGDCVCKANCRAGRAYGGRYGTGASCFAQCEADWPGCRKGQPHT